MNVLLIVPRYSLKNTKFYDYAFPIGLGYIASAIKHSGHNLACLNLNHYNGRIEEIIATKLKSNFYQVICTRICHNDKNN